VAAPTAPPAPGLDLNIGDTAENRHIGIGIAITAGRIRLWNGNSRVSTAPQEGLAGAVAEPVSLPIARGDIGPAG